LTTPKQNNYIDRYTRIELYRGEKKMGDVKGIIKPRGLWDPSIIFLHSFDLYRVERKKRKENDRNKEKKRKV
jgi:hypothetical protein